MICGKHEMRYYDKRSINASLSTMFGVESYFAGAQKVLVLGSNELLDILRDRIARDVMKNADIERVLDLPSSRVSEILAGTRRIRLDEAKKLVEAFELEESSPPLSEPVARLVVVWTAERLGAAVRPEDPQVADTALDLVELAKFAASPAGRKSVEAFEGFLHGIRLRQRHTSAA